MAGAVQSIHGTGQYADVYVPCCNMHAVDRNQDPHFHIQIYCIQHVSHHTCVLPWQPDLVPSWNRQTRLVVTLCVLLYVAAASVIMHRRHGHGGGEGLQGSQPSWRPPFACHNNALDPGPSASHWQFNRILQVRPTGTDSAGS